MFSVLWVRKLWFQFLSVLIICMTFWTLAIVRQLWEMLIGTQVGWKWKRERKSWRFLHLPNNSYFSVIITCWAYKRTQVKTGICSILSFLSWNLPKKTDVQIQTRFFLFDAACTRRSIRDFKTLILVDGINYARQQQDNATETKSDRTRLNRQITNWWSGSEGNEVFTMNATHCVYAVQLPSHQLFVLKGKKRFDEGDGKKNST